MLRKIRVANGIYWVEVPSVGVAILCGCPADSVKLLIKRGLIVSEEKAGVFCETGPNVILLSDVPLQNQRFSNLSEFPVLQMLYRQGMILPKHPNNTGAKPILVGRRDQVEAQMEYIYRGNYGLTTMDELLAAGASKQRAQQILRMKLRFAFEKIRRPEDFLLKRIIEEGEVEIKNGVFISRTELNVFKITYKGEAVEVDLNLEPGEDYEAPYDLGFRLTRRDYFSIIHSGEGDGWDETRPCMASIISFQGKIYLIDAGPNLLHSLTAMGISVNEIEGIFQTHAHDDHFNGLTILLRAEHRLKYYATALVRASVEKKLSSLVSIREKNFTKYFDIHDLEENVWNSVHGLDVMPIPSPHPVETTVMMFRALCEDGYKTYAHLADIPSFEVLKGMVTDKPDVSGISKEYFQDVKDRFMKPVDLKKIDAGGGMIHGNAEDFRNDLSNKIILSHTGPKLTIAQREIGSSTAFGTSDVLIPGDRNYNRSFAFQYLKFYFAEAPESELQIILNCPIQTVNPGSILVKKGEKNQFLYLILSGVMEFIAVDQGVNSRLSAGSIAGELSGILGTEARGTFRAVSYVTALKISRDLYIEFLNRNGLLEEAKRNLVIRRFFQLTWLLGEQISCPVKNRIARSVQKRTFKKGDSIESQGDKKEPELYFLVKGSISILSGNKIIETLEPSDFFGSEYIIQGKMSFFRARANENSDVFTVPRKAIDDIPICRWKIRETYERRIRFAGVLLE